MFRAFAPPNVHKMHTLRVERLCPTTKIETLRDAFNKYGEIGDIFIAGRGYAFVRFINKSDAEIAMEGMNKKLFDGAEILVKVAKQETTFTQNTAFITNWDYDVPVVKKVCPQMRFLYMCLCYHNHILRKFCTSTYMPGKECIYL